ncbi:MAG: hypothetical protein WCF18_20030 [Chthoniobacteraceae bacterium]
MRACLLVSLLVLSGAVSRAADAEFSLTEPRPLIVAPFTPPAESLIEAQIEPTKHELRFDDVLAAERWEQNFQLAARLPVAEAFSLRQEFRTGLQNETVLGDELTTIFHDALAMLEKTSAELKSSEALRIAASVQQQWLATNSVPFAEIVTYGVEAKYSPAKTTAVKLQLEWQDRAEFAATQSGQETYRLTLEQELVPKRLAASTGASLGHFDDAIFAERESFTRKMEGSLKWTPLAATALTLGGELSAREALALVETGEACAVKVQQQIFARSKLELQAGYELQTRSPLEAAPTAGTAWTLGANSDFAVGESWNAGAGVRYRLRDDTAAAPTSDELSFTLSVKGKF